MARCLQAPVGAAAGTVPVHGRTASKRLGSREAPGRGVTAAAASCTAAGTWRQACYRLHGTVFGLLLIADKV